MPSFAQSIFNLHTPSMAIHSLLLAALASSASAVNLYVASYAGTVSTLQVTPGLGEDVYAASAALRFISTNKDCGSAPSWLTFAENRILYCVDEGFATPNASVNTLKINADGSLTKIQSIDTIQGPVSAQFYNDGKNGAVALAHYSASAISTFLRTRDGRLSPLENFTFTAPPGPRPEQEKPHEHQAILDPTGKFLLFPDLGADVVRVYSFDSNSKLKEQKSLQAPTGSGPRHAVFWSPKQSYSKSDIYLFVIHELSNRIISYAVSYPSAGGLEFKKLQELGLYGDRADPVGTRAAEIIVSPDNNFVLASNRNATVFTLPNPDPSNSTQIPSDSIVTFNISQKGELTFQELSPSGGSFPRHFTLNKDGSQIAVANQNSGNVVIWKRDAKTGKIGDRLATAEGLGQTTNVLFDES